MPRLSDRSKTQGRYEQDAPSSGRRRGDSQPRERRIGPSRLSGWTGGRVVVIGALWMGLVLLLVALAALVSFIREGTAADIRLGRSNLIGLGATLMIPPLCLTAQWWRMRNRRRRRSDGPR